MNIDAIKKKTGIWFEDKDGNIIDIPEDKKDVVDYVPDNAISRHVSFPLAIREEIYILRDENGNDIEKESNRYSFTSSCHIGGGNQDLIIAMVNSGDFTLSEALGTLAHSCERCLNVISYKYLNAEDGYAEFSEEWYKCNTYCKACEDLGGSRSEDT